ncbi:MAG: glucan 1,4-alpha-glucosidase [Acidobacteria bacterium]|nr:glucan 1,4-alpha-glucosidase [Acidobacteriota bacterium]
MSEAAEDSIGVSWGDGNAPGAPGVDPRWTSSAKSGVGTALSAASRVWFTLSHGILNEVYYPRVDQACIRDLGLIVTADGGFFSEEKRDTASEVSCLAPGVPAYRLVNSCRGGRYRIEKEVLCDPRRDVVLQRIRFRPLAGEPGSYRVYVLLAPHLANHGAGNTAWIGDYKGTQMLVAERDGKALALVASVPWLESSAGFVGPYDAWHDLRRHGCLSRCYRLAENGNVALAGRLGSLAACEGLELALGFGTTPAEAGQRALASLLDGFAAARTAYCGDWSAWQRDLLPLASAAGEQVYRTSMGVLRSHEAKSFPGGLIASLSIPWGFAKGDDDLGGYHLTWPRDLVESAGGLLAAGAHEDVLRVLRYLQSTQESDGHWPQNMWLDGTSYWSGIQMDEAALPVLLVDLARREGALDDATLASLWPMVRKAAGYIVCNGPVTQQDRWEEDPGLAPFTLAAEIAALLVAADLAELHGESFADYLRETADSWNDSIERWTYVSGTDLAREHGVDGYYVRIAPPENCEAASPASGFVPIKNRPPGQSQEPAIHIVSPDALALVRFGLRAADDPRIVNTCKVIDAILKSGTKVGPAWHRYNDDGYGEHEDGRPFDGTGIGRPWPLLTGERAHYELAAGRKAEATDLLAALEEFAGSDGLLPEQVWDGPDLPNRELYNGHASGSAMPLVWAHAEYVKLLRSLRDGRVFDLPPQTVERYQREKVTSSVRPWRFNHKLRSVEPGAMLRIEVLAPARVHWSSDGWQTVRDAETRDTGLGIHLVDLPTSSLASGAAVDFTFFWTGAERWEGVDFRVAVD